MFPGLSTFWETWLGNKVSWFVHLLGNMARKQCFLVCPPLGNMARKQCFLVCPPLRNMATKQCFLVCPPLGNMAGKQCFLVCPPLGNIARKQCFLVCPPLGNKARKQCFLVCWKKYPNANVWSNGRTFTLHSNILGIKFTKLIDSNFKKSYFKVFATLYVHNKACKMSPSCP